MSEIEDLQDLQPGHPAEAPITPGQMALYIKARDAARLMAFAGTREAVQDTDAIRFLFETGDIASGNWAVYGYA